MTGITPKELVGLIELPDSCYRTWSWFVDLHATRPIGFSGALPITYAEMKSYFDLFSISPLEWEKRLLRKLDNVFLDSVLKVSDKSG